MIRIRVHDDGRWAIYRPENGRWDTSRGTSLSDAYVHGPGWSDAVVLPVSEQGARRLAEASVTGFDADTARVVLDRLAAGRRVSGE